MRKQLIPTSLTFLLIFISSLLFAQVGINIDGGQPDPSAMLDVKSSTKGFLPPRMALTSANLPAPVEAPVAVGLLVYNTTTSGEFPNRVTPGYYYWGGTRWVAVATPNGVNSGEMLFWDGSTWVTIPMGAHGQQLYFCNGIPTWGGCYAVLTAANVTNITATTAVSGGEVISDGGTPVVARGVCWSTSPDPTIADDKAYAGSGIGVFVANLSGLSPNTTYYLRAFATNSLGTSYAYGTNQTFVTEQLTNAPVTFLPELTFCPGGVIDIPVYVSDFNYISSLSLTLHYGSGSLTFNGATNTSGFPALTVDDATPGTLAITGNGNPAVTYPDSTILCTLHFTYSGGTTDLNWYDNGPSCQYVAGNQAVLYDIPASTYYLNGHINEAAHVQPPVFDLGSTSARCQGGETVTYTAASAFSTSIIYTLDPASVAALNSIDANTGMVTYHADWSGTSVITAEAQGCVGPVSATHTVTINPQVQASVSIVESANNVCTGTEVTYTATAVNGGTSPVYQWRVNGAFAGTNSTTFAYIPLQGDAVTCSLTSNAGCIGLNPVISNTILMTVHQPSPVSVIVTPSANSVCAGTQVTFTAAVVNGGSSPTYQWKINGVDAGTSNFEFSYQPANGDIVTCRVLSNATCISGNPAMSNEVVMLVEPLLPVSISIEASVNSVCAGTEVTLTASITNGGTDPDFQWRVNGNNVGQNGNSFTYIPVDGDQVTCILTSDEACASGNPALSNTVVMIVNPMLPVSVSITASDNSVCAGTLVNYTATPVNGGSMPFFQWMINGNNTGSNSAVFSYTPLNGDVISCVLTSDVNCSTGNPSTSNLISMIVNPLIPASVTISASANPVCAGAQATFTAVAINGGSSPVYQWKVNGNNTGTNNPIFTYMPVNNDQVTCEMTSNIACIAGNPVMSNTLSMTVSPLLPVGVSINASDNPVCAGTQVIYTAMAVNGGVSPEFQWQVNGIHSGTNSATFTYSPSDFDAVKCILTSSETCVTGNPASSNTIDMTVDPPVTVGVTIAASANPICAGNQVSFTATPFNEGFAPVYQWKVNNENAGSNSPEFTYLPVNNDVVTCVLLSDVPCASNNPATSNAVTMIVTPLASAGITIEVSDNSVCAGSTVTFTASAINGGTLPEYQWKVNGVNVGTNNASFTYMPVDNDLVTCVLISNIPCVEVNPVFSNTIEMTVNPLLPVSVSIYTSITSVCEGTPVFFTATAVNGGTSPVYQWQVNGVSVGTNSASYSFIPVNGDAVVCIITSDEPCATGNPAISNIVNLTVTPLAPVSVYLNYSGDPICAGNQATFFAVPVNGGSDPDFQWYVNGAPAGMNSPTFTFVPVNGDMVSCMLTSNAPCATGNPAMSNTPAIVVNPLLPVSVVITASTNPVCNGSEVLFTAAPVNGGSSPVYQWKVNGINAGTNSEIFSYIPSNGDVVVCVLTSNAICTTGNPSTSNAINMVVDPILPVSISIDASNNNVCAGTTVTYTATPVNGGLNPVYQWVVNGANAGTNNSVFTYIPTDTDVVTCVLTSDKPCVINNPATSNQIVMTVNPVVSAGITISASANGVCAGTVVNYTASAINQGPTPVYQWKVNGINTGTNSADFSYIPNDNDLVMCVLTSSASCLTDNPVFSNTIPMEVNPLLPVSVSIATSVNPICDGLPATFTATPVNGGTSPVYQWLVNGGQVGTNDPIFSYMPSHSDIVICVLTSSESCTTGNPSNSNSVTMSVLPILPVSVSIGASSNSVCAGTVVTFTAVAVNGGTSPVYQWKVNGVNSGTNSPIFAYAPENNDQITCLLTSNETCNSGNPAVSNTEIISVDPLLPVSVLISAAANPVCEGSTVTFTAVPVNEGPGPVFQWKVNGINSGTNSNTFNYIPSDNDIITCILTSNLACTSGNPATSNAIDMEVNTILPVSVTVVASQNPVCYGTQVTFTATQFNGGDSPVYLWKVNGNDMGSNSSSFTYVPQNGDAVTCVLTSNALCVSGNPAVSMPVVMTVNPLLPVSLTIASSAGSVCAGSAVTLSATIVNGGSSPSLQWYVDGIIVPGETGQTFTFIPVNNNVVTCTLNSNATCATGSPAVSNSLTMLVNPLLPVSITIYPSANPVCSGTYVTFTATPANGGTNPGFQWQVKGENIAGATNSTFEYMPLAGDYVVCILTSNAICPSGSPAASNTVNMTVNPVLPVSLTIAASANPVCAGTQVNYTAMPVNGGTNPVYQWKVNGVAVAGATGESYAYVPVNNDQVTCVLTSNAPCPTGNPATSNTVIMSANPLLPVSVSIAASANPVCAGESVTFTATPVNGGNSPDYQWIVNGIDATGATNITFTYVPANNDVVSCIMISDAVCPYGNPATSNSIMMTVNPILPVGVSITSSANPICAGSSVTLTAHPVNGGINPVFTWKVNGYVIPAFTGPSYTFVPVNGDIATVTMFSDVVCPSGNPATSNPISLVVLPQQAVSITIVASANPVCAGSSVTYTASPVNGGVNPAYQWKVNGVNVTAATNVTYAYVPANNDQVSCQLTSNAACPAGNPAQSNTIVEMVNPSLPVSITIAPSANPVCAGTTVTYSATPVNGGTNPQYQWKVNAIVVNGATGSTYINVPVNGDVVTCVLTSNATCPTGNPATSNPVTMTVNPLMPVSVSIVASQNPVCSGTLVNYTATPVNEGTNPVYQWKVNGNVVSGATSTSYSFIPVHGDFITCVLTSNIGCATGNPATSNVITMTVNPLLPVSVSILASANTICAGTSVTYTATPVNGGSGPVYLWKVNGITVPGATNYTYSYAPVHGDSIRCILTSNATCPTGNPASSGKIIMIVNPLLPVSINISASSTNVCAGTTVTFTSAIVNGGTSPAYQWKVNGIDISGATNPTYAYVPLNNDAVTCQLTSNATCPSGNPAISASKIITVNALLPVSITIAASINPVCAGSSVTFTATPVNGGATPAYQWRVNGNDVVGATNVSYTYVPLNSDLVSCRLTSSLTCTSGNPATSTAIQMTVNQMLPVSITIAASANPVCAGTSATYTATPVNGGSTPLYQWKVNGANVTGATNVTYNYVPLNNDSIRCILTSNATCPSGSPASSNKITMVVNPILPVSVSISASANNVCSGTVVTFTATPVNGGTSPVYQWRVGGSNIPGATNATYAYAPVNNDVITCILTSNATCPSGNPALSNSVTMTINPNLPVSVAVVPSATQVCAGTEVTYTATPTNGGSSPAYQWKVNGTDTPGATNVTFNYAPGATDNVSCKLTSSLTCTSNNPDSVDVHVTVTTALPVSVTIVASANPVCAGTSVTFTATPVNGGTSPTYQWKKNGVIVSGATSVTYILSAPANNDYVSCVLTSNAPCATGSPATSNTITLTVNPATAVSAAIAASVYAVMPGTSVTMTATAVNGGTAPTYQWKLGTGVITGATNSTYTFTPADHDKITCVVTSSLSGCLSNNPATSNAISMIVYVTGTACSGIPTVSYGGETYNTVQIGTQCWFRENLKIGTKVAATVTQTDNSTVEKYCYANDDENCRLYGGLYQWAEMVQYLNGATNAVNWNPVPTGNVQGICPTGWHIPTNAEWGTLMTYLGGIAVTGGKIKEATTAHFNFPNTGATNSTGFTALPGGIRWHTGLFYYIGSDANHWTITSGGAVADVYYGGATYSINAATNGQFNKTEGLSVRCLKD